MLPYNFNPQIPVLISGTIVLKYLETFVFCVFFFSPLKCFPHFKEQALCSVPAIFQHLRQFLVQSK